MNVHLIDGTYELFRAHFGAPSASDKNGREVGATRGLIRSMAALLTQPDVTHVAAAFDTVIESFRNALFHGYKTGEGLPEELVLQFPLAERALAALGIVVWSMIEFEADDALATAAHQLNADARVTQVLLCSPDKDLAQCVIGDRIIGYDRMRERRLNEPGVLEKSACHRALSPIGWRSSATRPTGSPALRAGAQKVRQSYSVTTGASTPFRMTQPRGRWRFAARRHLQRISLEGGRTLAFSEPLRPCDGMFHSTRPSRHWRGAGPQRSCRRCSTSFRWGRAWESI